MAISSNLPAPLQAISPVARFRAGTRYFGQAQGAPQPSTKATLLTGTASPSYANFADMAAVLGGAQGAGQGAGRYSSQSSRIATAYSTAPIIRPGQFVNIYV